MKIYRLMAAAAAALVLFASCEKDNPENGKGGEEDEPEVYSEINGTKIDEKCNAVGLVSDASTGKGIAGVPVTDGYSYTVTDANGVYQMQANRYCRKVYISLPSGYKIPLDEACHMPAFFSSKPFDKSKMNRNDFKLESQPFEDNFTLIMIGDPQCQTDSDVSRYQNETVPDIQAFINNGQSNGRYPNPCAITLGDITFDSYGTWEPMKKTMSNVKLLSGSYLPFFQCIGNHDHNSKVSSGDYEATDKFVETFGPTDYSFNRGKAHIIVMDDIIVSNVKKNSSPNTATWEHDGGITDAQLKWLQADLEQVSDKADKIVFLCMHIPIRSSSSYTHRADVLNLLKQFKDAHVLIGHTHYPQNFIQTSFKCKSGRPVYEHIHGAACGGWWCCNSNVTGAPNGYSVYEIEGNTVKNWLPKGTRKDANHQMRVYDGSQIYTGTKQYEYAWYRASNIGGSSSIPAVGYAATQNCFVAEVWDDDASNWKVELYQGGSKVGDFTRIPDGKCANICITSYFFNELAKNTDTWTNKTASHYWYYKPASGKPSSEKNWEVRATQTIPDSGVVNTYSATTLTTGYEDF